MALVEPLRINVIGLSGACGVGNKVCKKSQETIGSWWGLGFSSGRHNMLPPSKS